MPKVTRDEMARRGRRRVTENASESRIAEANEVWHSTAIDDSRLRIAINEEDDDIRVMGGEPLLSTGKGKKGPMVALMENAKDSTKGRSASSRDGSGSKTRSDPVIISESTGHSFFSSVLQKCGYIIRQPGTNNDMFYDVMNFRKKLADWLVENEDEMKRIETDTSKFLKALNGYLTENFQLAMKPTKHETELIQPSLLHCLLGIESLQPHVMKIIMPMLAEAALSTSEDDEQLVGTILNQLKWLPTIVDGPKFTKDLLTVIDTAVFNCQSRMIKELPYVLPPNLHSAVAEKLLEKFSDDGLQLNIALMDCFSSLEIPEGYWSNIRNIAIDQMTNASLGDIPAYFAFVFRVESVSDLTNIITTVREKVELLPDSNKSRNHVYQVEILEKVGFCITVNPVIVKVWIKQIKDDLQHGLTESIRKIDLIMLLLFAESHKSAINVLKSLFADRRLTIQLFSKMMTENIAMVNQLFPTFSKILDSLMRNKESKCVETIRELTVQLFVGLSPLEAQTLMGNMTSILINFPPSRDTVLSILTKLSESDPKKLLHFASYLMGVLEYVMQFPARQIRSLMNILAILSQTEGKNVGETNNFNSEFSILLRKQLTHSNTKTRCFGVFGALATIRRMAEHQNPVNDRIQELLKLVWSNVERDEEACGIFFDELASCVHSLPMDICASFCEKLKTKFQKLWTLDADAEKEKVQHFTQRTSLKLSTDFDANRECSEDRLVIMFENQLMEMSPLGIPAHFRAVAKLESKTEDGNLVGIDALLGCPLLFPDMGEYYDQESLSLLPYNQRVQLGQYLVLAINLFRESVSAFINDKDSELRVKIWLRLENILKLQKLLVKHFESFPYLPFAYIAEKTIGSSHDGPGPSGLQAFRQARESKAKSNPKKVTKAKTSGPKSKKKKARTEFPDSDLEENENDDDADEYGPVVTKKIHKFAILDEDIQPKKIGPYLRRFDKSVFLLLRYPLRCDENERVDFSNILGNLSSVSQNPDRIVEVEKFNPETLVLLLTELKNHLTDDKLGLNILSIKNVLKYICQHINTIVSTLADNEAEDISISSENQMKLECCLKLLIMLMKHYFEEVKKLDKEERDSKVSKSIHVISRLSMDPSNPDKNNVLSQGESLNNVHNYLGNLIGFIKDPATALNHLELEKTIHDVLDGRTEMKRAIDGAAKIYLRRPWKVSSSQVDGILKIWLGTHPAPMSAFKHLAEKLLTVETSDSENENRSKPKLPNSSLYRSCTDTNFHVWYNAMFSRLSQFVHKNLRRRGDFDVSIREWIEAVNIFRELIDVTKINQRNLILMSLLRNCRMFLEAFISGGAELLPKFLADQSDRAQRFLKHLQTPCRQIQHICEHSKKKADLKLLKSVPIVKRVLETLIFRVREVLAIHGVADAFWIGCLAHRDLSGGRIDSQVVADSEILLSTDEDEDELDSAPLSAITGNGSDDDGGEVEVIDENSMDID